MHRGQTYLTATHSQLRYFCYFFLISRRDGENNGLLPVVPLLPPRSCVVSRPNSLPLPFRTPVACVAGVWRGREREFWASEKREGLSRAPRVSLAPKTWAKGHILWFKKPFKIILGYFRPRKYNSRYKLSKYTL